LAKKPTKRNKRSNECSSSKVWGNFGRPRPSRDERARVLIVCEGRKTEPNYLFSLGQDRRISGISVIPGTRFGGSPKNIVECAVGARDKVADTDYSYDEVWVVFDHDERDWIPQVIQDAQQAGLKIAFSNPCFELWYLLHFRDSRLPRNADGTLRDLRKELPGYEKADERIYDKLLDRQPAAIANAKTLRTRHLDAGNSPYDRPSTSVHELVEYLNDLAPPG